MKLAIGFITYNDLTAKYLPYFLPSLFASDYKDFTVLVADNSEEKDNANQKCISQNYPQIKFYWMGKNLGFAKAYNILINKAKLMGAEYFLMLNPDMLLEPDMIGKLYIEIKKETQAGAVIPKILRWNFEKKLSGKTDRIDSLGLAITPELRFVDIKQGEADNQTAVKREVFGFTGAAAMLRLKALNDIAYLGREYFDELFFMYKEDCDISCRLQLAGWKTYINSEAVCYHDRTIAGNVKLKILHLKQRSNRSRKAREWSFVNQMILFLKYKSLPFKLLTKNKIWNFHIKYLIYALIYEPFLLKKLLTILKIWPEIKKKRVQNKIKIDLKKIEKFMLNK